jgi:hypothetical protein
MALQKTTEKKLTEIFNALMNSGDKDTAKLVTEILRAECKVKRGTKFSLYDFVDKTAAYKALSGIYYDNGNQVATDSHHIIVLKEEYDPELEGKIIDKNGEEVEARFPNYNAVLPKSIEGWEPHEIDTEQFYSWIDERRAAYKLQNGGKHVKWSDGWFVRVGPLLFKADRFNGIIKAGKELGSLTLYTLDAEHGGVIQTEKGIFMSMPWRETDSDDVLILQ